MRRLTVVLLILWITTGICAAQPPVHMISDIDSGKFIVNSDTWLDDGTYIACGRAYGSVSNGRANGGYFILPPGAKNARIVPMADQEIDRGSNAATWVTSDGSIVSIVRNVYRPKGPGFLTEFVVWRAEPDFSAVQKYRIPQQSFDLVDAALLKNDGVCLYIGDYTAGPVLLALDRTLTPQHTVLLTGVGVTNIPGGSQKISALSGGDILLVNAHDSSVVITRFDSNLTAEWSRKVADRNRWALPGDTRRIGILEKKDGTIVLAVMRYDFVWAFIHLDASGDLLGSWRIRADATSGFMNQMVESDEGGVVFVTGAAGISPARYKPFVGTIRPDWTGATLFDCTPYARRSRRFLWMSVLDASRGRIRIGGRVAPPENEEGEIEGIASAEWDVNGEPPCEIQRMEVGVIPRTSTSSVVNITSTDYTPKFVGARYKQYLGAQWSAAVTTYPCTSINGTTRDTMVLSGNAYRVGIGAEPALIRTPSRDQPRAVSAAIVSIGGLSGSTMHVLPSITADTVRGFVADVTEMVGYGTPKLAIDTGGLVVLAVRKELEDSVVLLASNAPESNGSFRSMTRASIGVPGNTKLLDVFRARYNECVLLLGKPDTLFVVSYVPDRYGSLPISTIAVPFSADTAYWVSRYEIMTRSPDGLIYLNQFDGRSTLRTRDVGRIDIKDGGAYLIFRLSDPDSCIAVASSGGTYTFPSVLVDSITNVLPVRTSEVSEDWALGRIGDDACVFTMTNMNSDSPYCVMRYWRISREGMKLTPYTLEHRQDGSPTLWCESVMAGSTSFIGIPTNAIGQTACSETWSALRMKRDYPKDSLRELGYRIRRPNSVAPSIPHSVVQVSLPLVPIGPCGDLTMGVVEPIAGMAIEDEINPAVHDVIPSGLLPASVRSYTIRDVQGRIMRTVHDVVHGDIPTYDLPPGVYVMIMEHEVGKITTLPFMVMQR